MLLEITVKVCCPANCSAAAASLAAVCKDLRREDRLLFSERADNVGVTGEVGDDDGAEPP